MSLFALLLFAQQLLVEGIRLLLQLPFLGLMYVVGSRPPMGDACYETVALSAVSG
jgi:hypothetical protein